MQDQSVFHKIHAIAMDNSLYDLIDLHQDPAFP